MRYPNGVAGCYLEAGGLYLEEGSVAKCCSIATAMSSETCNNAVKSESAPIISDPTESTPMNAGSLFFYWNLSFFFFLRIYVVCRQYADVMSAYNI